MHNKISSKTKEENRNIPWIQIKGFRNRLVHDYGNVDKEFIYEAINYDVIELKQFFEKLLSEIDD